MVLLTIHYHHSFKLLYIAIVHSFLLPCTVLYIVICFSIFVSIVIRLLPGFLINRATVNILIIDTFCRTMNWSSLEQSKIDICHQFQVYNIMIWYLHIFQNYHQEVLSWCIYFGSMVINFKNISIVLIVFFDHFKKFLFIRQLISQVPHVPDSMVKVELRCRFYPT